MRHLLLSLSLLCCVAALSVSAVEARSTMLRWDDANARLTGFLLEACLVTKKGECAMQTAQRIPPTRTTAQVQVPAGPRVKCFQVSAVREKQQSFPSDRICLQDSQE
jgi:hypothetical protein